MNPRKNSRSSKEKWDRGRKLENHMVSEQLIIFSLYVSHSFFFTSWIGIRKGRCVPLNPACLHFYVRVVVLLHGRLVMVVCGTVLLKYFLFFPYVIPCLPLLCSRLHSSTTTTNQHHCSCGWKGILRNKNERKKWVEKSWKKEVARMRQNLLRQ